MATKVDEIDVRMLNVLQTNARIPVLELAEREIPEPAVERIEFRIQVGRCRCCRRRVQGQASARQISNALGSAASRRCGRPARARLKHEHAL